MIDISREQKKIIRAILDKYLATREVMALGSRVNGDAKSYSDLDLAIMGDTPLDMKTLALLKDAFAESDLPFRVDIIVWCQASESFRDLVQDQLQRI